MALVAWNDFLCDIFEKNNAPCRPCVDVPIGIVHEGIDNMDVGIFFGIIFVAKI